MSNETARSTLAGISAAAALLALYLATLTLVSGWNKPEIAGIASEVRAKLERVMAALP